MLKHEIHGTGEPLVLVHGITHHAASYPRHEEDLPGRRSVRP